MTFAKFFHQKRRETGLSLRNFCNKYHLDHGNMSKLERGILPAPQSKEKLKYYANILNISEYSDEWTAFFDLAAISARRIPDDIASDSEVLEQMPMLFRAIRDYQGNRDVHAEADMLKSLAEKVRKELR